MFAETLILPRTLQEAAKTKRATKKPRRKTATTKASPTRRTRAKAQGR